MLSLGVILGISGALCVSFGHSVTANVLWVFGNIMMLYRAYAAGDIDTVILFSVYECIAVVGLLRYALSKPSKL